jgi:hypothetical protein
MAARARSWFVGSLSDSLGLAGDIYFFSRFLVQLSRGVFQLPGIQELEKGEASQDLPHLS